MNTLPNTNKGNVLLVDDDKFLLDMYSLKFSRDGYTVHAALTVASALDTLRSGFAADAVVFDLAMPVQTGFDLLATIRTEKLVPHAVLVALSNQTKEVDHDKAAQLGATRFIVKASMIPSEVVNTVGEEIRKNKGTL